MKISDIIFLKKKKTMFKKVTIIINLKTSRIFCETIFYDKVFDKNEIFISRNDLSHIRK